MFQVSQGRGDRSIEVGDALGGANENLANHTQDVTAAPTGWQEELQMIGDQSRSDAILVSQGGEA